MIFKFPTKGLCHSCLNNNVELIEYKGNIICMTCYHNKFTESQVNKTYDMKDVKEKFERK